jgi:hypothetical protein
MTLENQNLCCRTCNGNGTVLTEMMTTIKVCPSCGGSGEQQAAPIGVASKELLSITNCDSTKPWGNDTSWMKAPEPRNGFRKPKTSKHSRQKQNRRRDA